MSEEVSTPFDPIESSLQRVVLRKRRDYLRRAVDEGIINDEQADALFDLYVRDLERLKEADAVRVVEWRRIERRADHR